MELLRLHSNDLIDIGLYVSVTKSTRPNFGRRLKTASAKSSKLSGMDKLRFYRQYNNILFWTRRSNNASTEDSR